MISIYSYLSSLIFKIQAPSDSQSSQKLLSLSTISLGKFHIHPLHPFLQLKVECIKNLFSRLNLPDILHKFPFLYKNISNFVSFSNKLDFPSFLKVKSLYYFINIKRVRMKEKQDSNMMNKMKNKAKIFI